MTLLLVSFRILIGLFFIIVSGEKLLQPYQNFLYVVQSYNVFPSALEEIIARVIPWIQFFLGLFLLLGLWLKWTLRAFMLLVFGFVLLLTQAIVRKLPLQDCGCFGGLFSFPVPVTLTMDIAMLLMLGIMSRYLEQACRWSLDEYFAKSESS